MQDNIELTAEEKVEADAAMVDLLEAINDVEPEPKRPKRGRGRIKNDLPPPPPEPARLARVTTTDADGFVFERIITGIINKPRPKPPEPEFYKKAYPVADLKGKPVVRKGKQVTKTLTFGPYDANRKSRRIVAVIARRVVRKHINHRTHVKATIPVSEVWAAQESEYGTHRNFELLKRLASSHRKSA